MTHAAAAEPVSSNDTATNDLTLCPALAFQQTAMGGSAFIHGKILGAVLLTGHKAN